MEYPAAYAWTLCSMRSHLLWYRLSIGRSTTSTQQTIGPLSLDYIEIILYIEPPKWYNNLVVFLAVWEDVVLNGD